MSTPTMVGEWPTREDADDATPSGADTRAGGQQDRRPTGVSVLIPTHRDAGLLPRAIDPLLAGGGDAVEIVILNNDPRQEVRAAIGERAADPRVAIVEMGYEAGFSVAINRGIHESNRELVMLSNADLFPSASYLQELERFFADRPHVGAASGKLLRYDLELDRPTSVIDSAGLVLTRQRRIMPRGEGQEDVGQLDNACEVFALDGAGLVVRRRALESVRFGDEYLDSNFFMHKDDHDLSWRLRLAGWECWYVPSAIAYHGRTTRGLGSTRYRSALRDFHRNEQSKSQDVRVHALKNQWLMLVKNEDGQNFARDFPHIVAREAAVVGHHLLFAPRSLAAIPLTVRLLPQALAKRRVIKRAQSLAPSALRRWIHE
jgi:GT2 family glycosyltransferase